VLFGPALSGHTVLHRQSVLVGDVLAHAPHEAREQAWIDWRETPRADAVHFARPAAEELTAYTRGVLSPHKWLSIDGLIREAMPPLEDLVIGGHPGPIGLSSAIAVLVGGLFLLYRGVIDYRVPLLTVLAAYLALLVLPVPVALSGNMITWRPIFLPRAQLDWSVMLTFANYQVLASPLLFVAFFLATSHCIAPMHARARVSFALLLGLLCAAAQVYFSCALGPYVALLVMGLFSPWLDDALGRRRGRG
jgi:Na+-translocating ferredoxin:NAD+ oxidoreductase RnfD subunit